jgi:hypothetical protein
MDYSCKCCERAFGENRIKYEYHLTTNAHKRKYKITESVEKTPTDLLMDMVKSLKQQVAHLTGSTPVEKKRDSTEPLSFTNIIKNKLYTVEQMIDRENTDILQPNESWTSFINSAYKHNNRENFISCDYEPLQTSANLLITKFMTTTQELLPIIVLNNNRGRAKKIAYYTDGSKFKVKTDIVKKESIELFNRIDVYLFKSFAQLWLEDKLKDIYRTLPIEIRSKVHYRTIDDDKISFLDFTCTCCDSSHIRCFRDMLVDDEHYKLWRYKERELLNVDGKIFILTNDEYFDFVSDIVNHINEHEYGYAYNEYRQNRDLAKFDEESEKKRMKVVNEVFEIISTHCSYIVVDD